MQMKRVESNVLETIGERISSYFILQARLKNCIGKMIEDDSARRRTIRFKIGGEYREQNVPLKLKNRRKYRDIVFADLLLTFVNFRDRNIREIEIELKYDRSDKIRRSTNLDNAIHNDDIQHKFPFPYQFQIWLANLSIRIS